MEIDKQKNKRDDQLNDSWSFGNSYNACSQSRKISIGVMADTNAKIRSGTTKEVNTSLPNSGKVISGEKIVKDGINSSEVIAVKKRKQSDAPEQQVSPWVSIRSLHQETLNTKEVQFSANRTSNLHATSSNHNKFDRVEEAPTTEVQFYANRTTILLSPNEMQKKFDTLTYGRTSQKGGNAEGVEFAFATAQEVHVLGKGSREEKSDEKEKRSIEALRMKLWEVLGTAPSPKEHNSDSQTLDVGAENLNQKGCKIVKPRQNSDTIETDSEIPDETIRRPVTRSLTRRKVQTKVQPKLQNNSKSGGKEPSSFSYRWKHQEKNVFSFEVPEPGGLNGTGGSSMCKRKKSVRVSSRIKPHKILFPEKDDADKIQATNKCQIPPLADKTSSFGNRTGTLHSCPPENIKGCIPQENGGIEGKFHHSPVIKHTDQQGNLGKPSLQENANQQHDFDSPFLKKNVDQQDDLQSPTFAMKTPIKSCSSSPPSLKSNPLEEGVHSLALADARFTIKDFLHSRTLQTSRAGSYGVEAHTKSSDGIRDLKESPFRESSPVIGKKDAEYGPSQSPSKGQDTESSEEDLPMKKVCRTTEIWSQVRPTKRFCSKEGTKTGEFNPSLSSSKGTEESDSSQVPSEQNQEDGLARAVAMFTLALERFKVKTESQTNKKSSAILASVADAIQLQLQHVDSQIQTDVRKFMSLNKSEKYRLETRFQEQQEQLKFIHEKFKEEVEQHLQGCRSTLDRLEAYQIERKGTAERQRALHRKLLLQVEEAIENQLGDAEQKIKAIHKMAREKMVELKHVITECLREGIFS